MSGAIEFFVAGNPATQGSKRMVRTRRGRTLMIDSCKRLKPWREQVAACARAAGVRLIDGDVAVRIVARWERPAAHRRKDGTLRPCASARAGKADCDKVARAICDALAGVAYENDRQVAALSVERVWCIDGESEGATITVATCPPCGSWSFS